MSKKTFSFDHWQVDTEAGTITQFDVSQAIDNKVMKVLLYLVERAPQVVSREELLTALWPDQFVGDDVLNVAISTLRKHLKDSSRQPKYIKTIPRKGYQWLSEVCWQQAAAPSHLTINQQQQVTRANKSSPRPYLIGLCGLFVLLALGIVYKISHIADDAVMAAVNVDSDTVVKTPAVTANKHIRLAVLPFDLFAANQDNLYLANGITEAIINRLVQDAELRVISRSSVMQYQFDRPSVATIAKELKVDWILEGSLQIAEQEMQVTVQLINSTTDEHVWSHTYQKTLLDIFDVQAEIAGQVLQRFSQSSDADKITNRVIPRAYDHYLKARYYLSQGNYEAAIEQLEQALVISPDFAEALATRAQVNYLKAYGDIDNAPLLIKQASRFTLKAVEIQPQSAQVQLNLALHYVLDVKDYDKAGVAFAKAYALDEQDLMLQEWYINYLNMTEQFDKALAIADKMYEVSPLAYNKLSKYFVLYYAGKFDQAIAEAQSKRALISAPGYADVLIAWCYLAKNDVVGLQGILPQLASYYDIEPDTQQRIAERLSHNDIFGAVKLLYPLLSSNMADYDKAELAAWSGDDETVLTLLEQLVNANHINARKMAIEPAFKRLQQLPRFRHLLQRLQLN